MRHFNCHKILTILRKRLLIIILMGSVMVCGAQAGMLPTCQGHFVDPITDICWECLFPITIGDADVVPGDTPDTANPALPIQICPSPIGYRIGITVGFWEPFALTDVSRQPFCLVNMGGIQLDIDDTYGVGGHAANGVNRGGFYYVHWYKYPVIFWLQLITYIGCMETGDFDLAYMTEIDPTWDDDELAEVINPEASLFASAPVQAACAADAVAASTWKPIDELFWCMGSQGGAYPLTGHVYQDISPASTSVLISERMAFKLHREGLIWETLGTDATVCNQYPTPLLPKSRFRYQMTNTIAAAYTCMPFGRSTLEWETGHLSPSQNGNFGYLIWRKRNCVYL